MPLDVSQLQVNRHLALSCLSLWLFACGTFILSVEATSTSFLILLLSGPILMYYGLAKVAIPQPNDALVTEIIGRDIKPTDELKGDDAKTCQSNGAELDKISMKVIAHRFSGIDAPENTLEALDLCYKNGAIGAEFDLVFTKDLVPVLFHDEEVDRVSNSTGRIQDKTWEELKNLDVSVHHPFNERFVGSKIPLFEDVIKKIIEYDMRIFIDIKDDRPQMTDLITETFQKYPILYRRAVVSSFNFWVVYWIRRKDPNIVASMAWRPKYYSCRKYDPDPKECEPYSDNIFIHFYSRFMDAISTWFFHNLAVHLVGFSVALINKDVISAETIQYWKARNVRVIAWTVNKPVEKLHLVRNLGIAYMTDSMLGN